MISGHGNIETAVRATKLGAFDFIEKPLSLEKVIVLVRNAIQQRRLQEENQLLRTELGHRYRSHRRKRSHEGPAPADRRHRPHQRPRFDLTAKAALAKNWSPARCTQRASATRVPLWK